MLPTYIEPKRLYNITHRDYGIHIEISWLRSRFVERYVTYSQCKQKVMSFRGQASWAKMTSLWGQANSTGMPPDQKVNKAEELTYLSANIW
jgi:hypothetical protein